MRIKDVDLDRLILTIRDGKGGKDRTTCLPASLVPRSSSSAPAAVTASATPANMRGRVVVVLDMGPPKQGDGNSGLCSSLAIRRRAG